MRLGARRAAGRFSVLLALSIGLAACDQRVAATMPGPSPVTSTAPTLTGDAAHPASTQGWVRTELYFGLGPADDPAKGISESDWREFLDHEVTPRFPSGLSVADIYGQWQGKGRPEPVRIRSKVLIILYPGTDENTARIEAIRAAWKQKTGQQSVLRVTQPADVSF
jgi:hypothetical protein